ncbi:transcription factor 19-like [Plectropomus leopardus]|uniref:transcription factor 19-like n=1 Tax=Plectropomus leopardus TaxID=160734 RepID=UPI001C4A99BB|nr:transcription factor 19-like [Plectropomus leopardus]XP_042355987.1 transcription factor 19-like [Plectropomus leopardus]
MAKAPIKAFPAIPDMNFSTSKKEMAKERRDLVLDILEASVFDDQDCCAMCDTFKPPGQGTAIVQWIQCDNCDRWFHGSCLSMDIEDAKDKTWKCPLCQ